MLPFDIALNIGFLYSSFYLPSTMAYVSLFDLSAGLIGLVSGDPPLLPAGSRLLRLPSLGLAFLGITSLASPAWHHQLGITRHQSAYLVCLAANEELMSKSPDLMLA